MLIVKKTINADNHKKCFFKGHAKSCHFKITTI